LDSTYTGPRSALPLSASGARATQTKEHRFKVCPKWKGQQKILWAEVRKGRVGRAGGRSGICSQTTCGQAVLDFLSSTDVGRLVPPVEEGPCGRGRRGRDVSECELRERREREEELRAG